MQDFEHEFLENGVLLGKEMDSYAVEAHEIFIGFKQGEKLPEILQKVRIQEVGDDSDLYILRQLPKKFLILFVPYSQTLVRIPSVFEKVLDFLL